MVTKNLMVTLVELHDHICRSEKLTEGQISLQQSGLYGGVARCNPLLSEDTRKHLEFAEKHLKDPQTVRNNILWSDEPQF